MKTPFVHIARIAARILLCAAILGLSVGSWLPVQAAAAPSILAASPSGANPAPVGSAPQSPQAVLPTNWAPLNDLGLSNVVRAIAVYGTNVYVGGDFTQSYDGNTSTLYNIARYDTLTGTWHSMGIGLNDSVYAIAVGPTGMVYVGGSFTMLGDNTHPEIRHIAEWNPLTSAWSPLFANDQGLNGDVLALAYETSSNDLWIGGSFTDDVSNPLGLLQHFLRYNTAGSTYNSVQCKGLNAAVNAIAVSGSNIYVGGTFSATADSSVTCANTDKAHLNKIAKYSGGTSWTALADFGLFGAGVNALAADAAGDVYVGGSFSSTFAGFTTNMNNFGIYTGAAWLSPSTYRNGLVINTADGNINSLALIGTDLYVGGQFTKTGDTIPLAGLNNMAVYRANNWVQAPGYGLEIGGGGGSVDAIGFTGLPTNYNIYAGGAFDTSGDMLTPNLRFIASLGNVCNATGNSGNWSTPGTWTCGEAPTSADKVTIPANATITLNTDATVNGTLTLNGNIDASVTGNTLTLGPNSSIVGAGDIFGAVQRIAPVVGAALAYNNAKTTVTFWGSSPASLKVSLTKTKPTQLTSYVKRIYALTPTGSFGFATLQLAYKTSDFVSIRNESLLQLMRYDTVSKHWVLMGGTVDILNHWVTLNNVSSFSSWTFYSPSQYFIPRIKR